MNISGFLDKWPVSEYLVGVDNQTGGYTAELATEWSIADNGKDWTFKLREDIPWQDGYGNFTAEDVRHSMWLLVQPTAAPSGASTWRKIMGTKRGDDEAATMARAEEVVEIVDDHEVIIHLGHRVARSPVQPGQAPQPADGKQGPLGRGRRRGHWARRW